VRASERKASLPNEHTGDGNAQTAELQPALGPPSSCLADVRLPIAYVQSSS
jgi:hypothetical protein